MSNTIIQAKSVYKTFHLGKVHVPALQNFSIDIKQGQSLVFTGASGCGKSTALNLLGALDVPTSGEVNIFGENSTKMADTKLAKLRLNGIGFIFQTYNLIPVLTALENVLYPLRLSQKSNNKVERAKQMLEDVGLGDLMKNKPNEMSGGQRQRVAIARALVAEPKILFADEPTANLDSKTSHQIIEIIDNLRKRNNTTLIACSHHSLLIESCEQNVVMSDGTITQII